MRPEIFSSRTAATSAFGKSLTARSRRWPAAQLRHLRRDSAETEDRQPAHDSAIPAVCSLTNRAICSLLIEGTLAFAKLSGRRAKFRRSRELAQSDSVGTV